MNICSTATHPPGRISNSYWNFNDLEFFTSVKIEGLKNDLRIYHGKLIFTNQSDLNILLSG